jgi:lipopolysaccharide export system permease protein
VRITSKYVLREHLGPLTFALSALTSLLLLNYIARKFGDLVGKGLPWQAIVRFFVLSVPFTVAMTLPMAVLVSTLYAFSRLASENEITAFKASGVSMTALLAPVIRAAAVVALLMVGFNDQVLPAANHQLSVLLQDIGRTKPTFTLRDQVINEITPSFLIRAARVDQQRGTMRDVTIYDMTAGQTKTIRADSGALAFAKNQKDLLLSLFHGNIDQVEQGKPESLRRIYYQTNLVLVKDVASGMFRTSDTSQVTYKSDREMSVCELSDAYLRARREFLLADLELRQALADSAGKPKPTETPRRRVFLGLGRVYCRLLNAIPPRAASAAEVRPLVQPPAGQPPATQPPATQPPATQPPAAAQPPRDTVRRDTVRRDTVRRDSVRRDSVRRDTVVRRDSVTGMPINPNAQPVVAPAIVPGGNLPQPAVPPPGTVPGTIPGTVAPGSPTTTPNPAVPGLPADTSGAAVPIAPSAGASTDTTRTTLTAPGFATSALMLARMRLDDTRTAMNGYLIEVHKKFALATACLVFVLIGAPIALRFPRGGVGMVLGVSLFVFALYYSFLVAGEELAQRGFVPPAVSMWAANVIFAIVGVALASRMGTESGSARGGGLGELVYSLRARFKRRGPTP